VLDIAKVDALLIAAMLLVDVPALGAYEVSIHSQPCLRTVWHVPRC